MCNVDDCECEDGYYKYKDYCKRKKGKVDEEDCPYECPKYSHLFVNKRCPFNYQDCKCKEGYYMYDGYCKKQQKCKYECPEYSYHFTKKLCPYDYKDCKCEKGYYMSNGYCKKFVVKPLPEPKPFPGEKCAYTCPDNSYHYTSKTCPYDYKDCKCNTGYLMVLGYCKKFVVKPLPQPKPHPVVNCDYTCPKYSEMYVRKMCPENHMDCKCKDGYYMHVNGYCKKKEPAEIMCEYECPKYSYHYTDSHCPHDYYDCKCKKGYYMHKDGYCAKYKCSYKCPKYSYPNVKEGCPSNYYDCKCYFGYEMNDYGKCKEVCTYECPENSKKKPKRRCYNNFDDCECYPDYYKYNDACVSKHKFTK